MAVLWAGGGGEPRGARRFFNLSLKRVVEGVGNVQWRWSGEVGCAATPVIIYCYRRGCEASYGMAGSAWRAFRLLLEEAFP